MCLFACEQQRCRSRVSAPCWAVQHLCGGGLPGWGSRTQENESSWGLSGMLLWEKDPCCTRVCNRLWVNFKCRRWGTWICVTTCIALPFHTVRMTNLPETCTKGKCFIAEWHIEMKTDFTQCSLSEGGLSITCWLAQHWQSSISRKVSRHMICHQQQQVSRTSSLILCLSLLLASDPWTLDFSRG